ncbi:hypothetical protein [Polaribacter sp. KT 15]|uniref:hypothetical protein n=1 Tax=Polaribacter sp. KT 15 TaxID=1896175 RepID=UPI00090CA93B|nr:hypothetical protein [Polaribacter sp. KT 15]SHN08374.1 hypothetical protein SAMN05720268_2772 [Polaribacter sp. KT 15]
MTSDEIFEKLLEGIYSIDIGRFDYNYIPLKSDFTKAITNSIVNSCKALNLKYKLEFEFVFNDDVKEEFKKRGNFGYTDIVIYNKEGKDIAIEIDSSFKKWSFKKLDLLREQEFDSYWFVWKRKTPGRNIKWADPLEIGFDRQTVKICTYTFIADEEKLATTTCIKHSW